MSENVIGIDQSLTGTAYVVMDKHKKIIVHGMIRTTKEDYLQIGCGRISQELKNVVVNCNASLVSIEGLSYGSIGNATRNLAVLMGWIQSAIYYETCWLETPATTLKKYATGNGKAKKHNMLESLPEPFQQEVKDTYRKSGKLSGLEDIPDAYWLACRGVDDFYSQEENL